MTQGAIMTYMLEYLQKANPSMTAESLAEQNVTSVLTDSLDVVEFMMYMEDRLGVDTQFDLTPLRARIVNCNFRELAGEILRLLAARGTAVS